jgi:TolA-binding protein
MSTPTTCVVCDEPGYQCRRCLNVYCSSCSLTGVRNIYEPDRKMGPCPNGHNFHVTSTVAGKHESRASDRHIVDIQQQVVALQQQVAALQKQVAALQKQVAALQKQVAALQQQLVVSLETRGGGGKHAGAGASASGGKGQPKQAEVCSFYQRGLCTRGDSCPFRHDAK